MKKKPERLTLEADEIEGLKERLSASSLSSADKKILGTILEVYVWLYDSLQEAKMSISRLKSFFGFIKKTEKNSDCERTEGETQDGSDHSFLLEAAKEAAFGSESESQNDNKKKSKKRSRPFRT